MTSLLRRKPRTTVRAATIPARTRASLVAGVLLLLGGIAVGQQPQGAGSLLPVASSSNPAPARGVAPGKPAPTIIQTSGTSVPALVRQGRLQKGEGGVGEEKTEY